MKYKPLKINPKTCEKWFRIEGKIFYSKTSAKTLHDAFEKTICKWALIAEHDLFPDNATDSCGLCDYSFERMGTYCSCIECPVLKYTYRIMCKGTPANFPVEEISQREKEHELMFLLSLYEWNNPQKAS